MVTELLFFKNSVKKLMKMMLENSFNGLQMINVFYLTIL